MYSDLQGHGLWPSLWGENTDSEVKRIMMQRWGDDIIRKVRRMVVLRFGTDWLRHTNMGMYCRHLR